MAEVVCCVNCGCVTEFLEGGFWCQMCGLRFKRNTDKSATILGSDLKWIENMLSISHYQIVVDGAIIMAHVELGFGDKRIQGSALEMPNIEYAVACAIWKAFAEIIPSIPKCNRVEYFRWLGGGGETRIHIGSDVFVRYCEHENSVVAVMEAMLEVFPSLIYKNTEEHCHAM